MSFVLLLLSSTEGWTLPKCPGKYSARTWTNCEHNITFPSGHKYDGQWKNGKLHGRGTLTSPEGHRYVGQFKDNKFNGQGTYAAVDGSKYVGEWKDGKTHGQGTLTKQDGTKFEGVFKKGKFKYTRKVSPTVVDEKSSLKVNSKKSPTKGRSLPPCPGSPTSDVDIWLLWTDCFGTYNHKFGTYAGKWKDGKWHGHGTYTFANGDKYVGEFKDGNRHGQGTFTYARGSKINE